jgi:hypothetical protein
LEPSLSPIAEIYQQIIVRCLDRDEQLQVFTFIQKSDLEVFINDSIDHVESITQDVRVANKLKADQIKTIAYSFLKRFNKAIAAVEDQLEKTQLKKLLVKIANGILFEIQQQSPGYADHVRKAIEQGLEQAVAIEGYDKKDFENYFQINYTDISTLTVTITKEAEFTEYFNWNHKKANLQKLISLLHKDYYCLRSKTEFESLFDSPQNKDLVRWDINKSDLLIVLIHQLYEADWIILKGGKGLWKIIKGRIVDFDKNPLEIDFAKRLNIIKGNKRLKAFLAADIDKIMDYIKIQARP